MPKAKDREDLETMQERLKEMVNKNYNYTPEPEWEDQHPILATLVIIAALLFNPISLMIIGIFTLLIILITGVVI